MRLLTNSRLAIPLERATPVTRKNPILAASSPRVSLFWMRQRMRSLLPLPMLHQPSPEQAASLPLTWLILLSSLSPLVLRSLILLPSSTERLQALHPLLVPHLLPMLPRPLLPLKHRLPPTLARLLKTRLVLVLELERDAKPSQRPPPAQP